MIVEEANNAYLTFVTTNSGEKITLGKKLEAGSVEIEGSAFDINGGNIDGATIGAASAAAGTFTTITGSGNISFDGGSFVFNESGADKDFRIEGDTNANLFVADASLDSIGIGTNAPGQASLTGLGWSYQPLFHVHSSGPTLSYSGALDLRFIDTSAGSNAKVGDIHYEDQTWRFRTVNDSGSEVNANVLFVDGAGAKIGIGTAAPSGVLSVSGNHLNPVADLGDPDDYAIVIDCSSTTGEGNGIAFTNDDGGSVGAAVLHIDRGSANL